MLETLTLAVAVVGAGIAGMALARLPRGRTQLPLMAFVAAGLAWATGDLIADRATDPVTKQVGIAILYTGSISMPSLWWIVALRWSEDAGSKLPLRAPAWQWGPLAWAGLMWLAMITNPLHGQFMEPVVGGRNVYHALWWAMALPNYGLILAALGVEVAVARRAAKRETRYQAAFLIGASAVTLLGNWLYVANFVSVNLTALVLSVSVSLLLVGMAREGLFGVLPAALSTLAAEHPEGVIVVGKGGHVDYANARAEELLSPVLLRRDLPALATLQDPALRPETALSTAPEAEAEWWQALQGPTGLLFQVRGPRRRWLQVIAQPVSRGPGGDTGRLLRLSDVSRRREAELHTLQNRRLDSVSALAGTISRDFQSAFAIVRANAELLEQSPQGEAADRHLARILEAARVGADLAHELQLHTGSLRSIRTTLDLGELVQETCGLLEPELPEHSFLRHQRQPGLSPVEADPLQVRDCVFNLLTNAIEAVGDDAGGIEIETGTEHFDPGQRVDLVWGRDQPPGAFTYVRVRDEGGGMDAETEERAFEPFFSTRDKDRGTGLSTVVGIVRAHEGAVALENDPGWGCTVTLYFRSDTTAQVPPR